MRPRTVHNFDACHNGPKSNKQRNPQVASYSILEKLRDLRFNRQDRFALLFEHVPARIAARQATAINVAAAVNAAFNAPWGRAGGGLIMIVADGCRSF
jgi:hypothetical protein